MSESSHSIYKTEFLHGKYSLNEKTHSNDLERFVEYYNRHRYPTDLFGRTLIKVVNGKIPDKNHFKEKIQEARKNRVAINNSMIVKLLLVVIPKKTIIYQNLEIVLTNKRIFDRF
jgi:hypothetical protein